MHIPTKTFFCRVGSNSSVSCVCPHPATIASALFNPSGLIPVGKQIVLIVTLPNFKNKIYFEFYNFRNNQKARRNLL